jgi:hypothetical protein
MDLITVTEENLAEVEEKIHGDPELKEAILEDLDGGLESTGYTISEENRDEMEKLLRRILLDLKPLTEANLPEIEEKIKDDPDLQELLLEDEDMESVLESMGYYLSDELWASMCKESRKSMMEGISALTQEVRDVVSNEEERLKKTFMVEVEKGGE